MNFLLSRNLTLILVHKIWCWNWRGTSEPLSEWRATNVWQDCGKNGKKNPLRFHVGVKRCPTTATAGGLERWKSGWVGLCCQHTQLEVLGPRSSG